MTAGGLHDWLHCEQVKLLAVDYQARTITVRRGCYGTKPLAFRGGAARAAAHATEGPWGKNNNLLWYYNYATHCPRDPEGKTCADRLVDDLARWFGPQGVLAAFDGLEFDVLFHYTHGDTTGDGKADNGMVDGINRYGIGVVEFARQLRQRLGDETLILADGALGPGGSRSQRCWGLLNGIESEGWPNLNDWEFVDWSGGLNRHRFWHDNAREPAFSYINHKWIEHVPDQPGVERHPEVPFSRHRLAFAAAQFTDAVLCYSYAPQRDEDRLFGVWDEFWQGTEKRLGWLGAPEGPAVHLAERTPDLLAGQGRGETLAARIRGPVTATATPEGVRVVPSSPAAKHVEFTLRDVPTGGPDLFLAVEMMAAPLAGYPREVARFARVGIVGGMVDLMAGPPPETGMCPRGGTETPLDPASGANFQDRPRTVGGASKRTFFTHPPYQGGVGYTYWLRELEVPVAETELQFAVGMGERSPERSDGVWFRVLAATGEGEFRQIHEISSKAHEWLPQRVSLKDYAGRRVRLKFVADCGPADNATTDHAHWADVRLVAPGGDDSAITPAVQTMTWANDRPFRSTFQYHEVRSPRADVTFSVEGTEPVVLSSVRVHAHPDATARVFSRGLVLANPSRHPYTFDLAEISPGRRYRRIQGTPKQDTEANNGQPVGNTVTLGERDALFLLRVE